MQLFQELRKYGGNLGMHALDPNNKNPFNPRNTTFLIIYGLYFISSSAYLLFTANTFREYAMCFFIWLTLLFMNLGFLTMIFTSPILFNVADLIEEMIDLGKYYQNWKRRIFQWKNVNEIFTFDRIMWSGRKTIIPRNSRTNREMVKNYIHFFYWNNPSGVCYCINRRVVFSLFHNGSGKWCIHPNKLFMVTWFIANIFSSKII